MAAGGPGDHWITDLFAWNLAPFGEPVDSLLRDIKRLGGEEMLDDRGELGRRIWSVWPMVGRATESELQQLAAELTPIRDHLAADAKARGWETD